MRKDRLHKLRYKDARKLAFSIAAFLLFAQWSTLAHAASYGFDDHAHNGNACEISIVTESFDDLVPSDCDTFDRPFHTAKETVERPQAEQSYTFLAAHPRGPPSHA